MKRLFSATAAALVLAIGAGAPVARADADSATHYYLSLGDSLAAGTNATGVGVAYTDLGYADQLHAVLAATDPKLELKKLGCPGESTVSMRFGSQLPSVVGSCGPPRYYKNVLYSKGTQLAEAVGFLEAHKGKVADELNGVIAGTYAAAGDPVADVAGAFGTVEQVCAWTWFCTHFDSHPNATGYGVIANEFLEVIQP
jgi:hypothetical protein